jgi:hypothetical protein
MYVLVICFYEVKLKEVDCTKGGVYVEMGNILNTRNG